MGCKPLQQIENHNIDEAQVQIHFTSVLPAHRCQNNTFFMLLEVFYFFIQFVHLQPQTSMYFTKIYMYNMHLYLASAIQHSKTTVIFPPPLVETKLHSSSCSLSSVFLYLVMDKESLQHDAALTRGMVCSG